MVTILISLPLSSIINIQAKSTTITKDSNIKNRAIGRTKYSSTPFYGTSSNYNELVSNQVGDLKLSQRVSKLSVKLIAAAIGAFFKQPKSFFISAAGLILSDSADSKLDTDLIYYRKKTYAIKDDKSGMVYREYVTYYYSSAENRDNNRNRITTTYSYSQYIVY